MIEIETMVDLFSGFAKTNKNELGVTYYSIIINDKTLTSYNMVDLFQQYKKELLNKL